MFSEKLLTIYLYEDLSINNKTFLQSIVHNSVQIVFRQVIYTMSSCRSINTKTFLHSVVHNTTKQNGYRHVIYAMSSSKSNNIQVIQSFFTFSD
jgi:hypothetical protein